MQVFREGCTLGDWISKKEWTLAEYARRAGRSRRMISYFCNNERPMQPEDIHIAGILLGVTFEQLYVWRDNITNHE